MAGRALDGLGGTVVAASLPLPDRAPKRTLVPHDAVCEFADALDTDVTVLLQQRAQPGADERAVVGGQHADRRRAGSVVMAVRVSMAAELAALPWHPYVVLT